MADRFESNQPSTHGGVGNRGHTVAPNKASQLWRRSSTLIPPHVRGTVRRTGQLLYGRSLGPHHGLLLSYPKSGSTWLRSTLDTLIADRAITPDEIGRLVPPIHRIRHEPTARVFRSHDSVRTQGFSRAGRTVILVRDPRAVAPSYSKHMQRRSVDDMTVEAAAQLMLTRGFEFLGSWQSHIAAMRAGENPDAMVVLYENLLQVPEATLSLVADHLRIEHSPASVARAIEETRPDVTRARRVGAGLDGDDVATRKPTMESWRSECPAEVQRHIESACRSELQWLGLPTGSGSSSISNR